MCTMQVKAVVPVNKGIKQTQRELEDPAGLRSQEEGKAVHVCECLVAHKDPKDCSPSDSMRFSRQKCWKERKKVKSISRVQLFATPWTVVHPAPTSMRLSRQEYWSGFPFSSPGDLPNPACPLSPCMTGGFFTLSHLENQSSAYKPIISSILIAQSLFLNSLGSTNSFSLMFR